MSMKRTVLTDHVFRNGLLLSIFLLLLSSGEGYAFCPCPSPTPPPGAAPSVQHIIFIVQENRSFDSYFGHYPGAKGATTGMYCDIQTTKACPTGDQKTVKLNPLKDTLSHRLPDFDHSWNTAHIDYDSGQMDKFNHTSQCDKSTNFACYVAADQSDIPNYWKLADKFVLDDNAFSSVMGPSFPNHLYTVAARSGPQFIGSVIDNPILNGHEPRIWGCAADKKTSVETFNQNVRYITIPRNTNQASSLLEKRPGSYVGV